MGFVTGLIGGYLRMVLSAMLFLFIATVVLGLAGAPGITPEVLLLLGVPPGTYFGYLLASGYREGRRGETEPEGLPDDPPARPPDLPAE